MSVTPPNQAMTAEAKIPRVALQAVQFRACTPDHQDRYHDECAECLLVSDHGVIAYYHKNPLRRLVWRWFHKAT